VVERHVVADLGGLADHDAQPMVDEEPSADLGAGMDLDAGEEPSEVRQQPTEESPAAHPGAVRHPVPEHRVEARIGEHHLESRSGRRVACNQRVDLVA
jgi:hypothetical protein